MTRVLLSDRAAEQLLTADSTLLAAVERVVSSLEQDPHFGQPIARRLRSRFDTRNLFRVTLPRFWRLLYTLEHDEEGQLVIIVEILDHKLYDKRFGYKKK